MVYNWNFWKPSVIDRWRQIPGNCKEYLYTCGGGRERFLQNDFRRKKPIKKRYNSKSDSVCNFKDKQSIMTTQEKVTYPQTHSILTQTLKVKGLWCWKMRERRVLKKQRALPHLSCFEIQGYDSGTLVLWF